ncbi:MAG TPA: hypothetical protein VJ927_09105, partial [Actinomycetota bacterium]|nr:hypothetical protein [Actinomycetota bacterium]
MRSAPSGTFPPPWARLLAALVAVALLGACTGDGGGATPDEAGGDRAASPGGTGDSAEGSEGEGGAEGDEAAAAGTSAGVRADDRKRTVRGTAPEYVRIASASLTGTAEAFLMEVELAGRLPKRMPDQKSVLRAAFQLTAKDGTRYVFEAQCIRTGWGTFASGGTQPEYIPELTLDGRSLTLKVDPLYVGG